MVAVVRAWWVGWIWLVAACAMGTRPPPSPPRRTSLGLDLSQLHLSNGLRVVLVRDPRAEEIQVTMRYGVGSVDDPPDQPGMAHLVEHLMFQQVLGSESLFARLENDATYFNGATTLDATTYVARATPEHLDELFAIEGVRVGLRCTSITDETFAREREVVLNEIRQHDPATEALASLHRGIYPAAHPYRRLPAGTEASVAGITREQACAFADAHYTPGRAVLVVSGNLDKERVEASLKKFLARIPSRAATAPAVSVPRVELVGRHVEVPVPVDDDALLLAWPLPADPLLRIRVRAVAEQLVPAVDAEVEGQVGLVDLGDERAPMVGLWVIPAKGESFDHVLKGAERGIRDMPGVFGKLAALGELAFDRVQQTGIYRLFSTFEDGGDRDARLASYVLEGEDPSAVLAAQFQGLREMTREQAGELAATHLHFDRATVVVLKSEGGKKRGHGVHLAEAIHDLGLHRDPRDPAEAHQPLPPAAATAALHGEQTRQLPNGLKVVLLPLTSVPTVDVRLVFDSGTGDEPADKRGAALFAARTLSWDLHYLNDLLRFAGAGGTDLVDVDPDRTTFGARGLDMDLDLLLAGLRRWVRDGTYDRDAEDLVRALRKIPEPDGTNGALTEAWRTALFGAHHPYVAAGLFQKTSERLSAEDVSRFRATHYTPDNATLVIAGHFDAALADRWIDYLFADWTGHREVRQAPSAHPRPASLAQAADTSQVLVRLALPATGGSRASQLVAAAMLAEIAGDVRHQLGATYGLDAELVESRLATDYLISGWVDAARSRDAVELLRDRLAKLKAGGDEAASAFVAARDRVHARLRSITESATVLAARVERDVELARPPMSDLETATAVEALTIEQMTATLADLDLARAVVLMRGPRAAIDPAFEALGRTPTYVAAAPQRHDTGDREPSRRTREDRDPITLGDLAAPLTEERAATPLALTVATGYSTAQLEEHDVAGVTVAASLGYRTDGSNAGGLLLSLGYVRGSYTTGLVDQKVHELGVMPVDLAGFAQATAYDRLWGTMMLGLHLDRISDGGTRWKSGLGAGLQGGIDILSRHRHRLGIFGRLQGELLADSGFVAFTVGLAYRR